jgi:hypothetical protein
LLAGTAFAAAPVRAQQDGDTQSQMKRTEATFTRIDRQGKRREALEAILEHIDVSDGLEVSL